MTDPADLPCPPDELIREVTITATLGDNGVWEINCPVWKCQLFGKNLTKQASTILADIETHNEEILQGEPDWSKDPKKAFEANVLNVDHEARQARLRTLNRPRHFPEERTMTPGRSIYPDGRPSL